MQSTAKKDRASLYPIDSGEERCAPLHSWGQGIRPNYLIHYVVSGKGTFWCGGKQYEIRKGQIFVVFPWTVIKYQADAADPWHYAWVDFVGEEAGDILSQMGISAESPVFSIKNGAEVLEVIRNMPRERSADTCDNLEFSAKLYEFMSLLMKNTKQSEIGGNAYLAAAKRYIKAHYFDDITVDEVASYVGISRKYLFAIFKREMGVSPKDYMLDYRMKKAVEFLADENLSIGNIAYSVGYKDPLTFSKMFKVKMGVSPTEYRKAK